MCSCGGNVMFGLATQLITITGGSNTQFLVELYTDSRHGVDREWSHMDVNMIFFIWRMFHSFSYGHGYVGDDNTLGWYVATIYCNVMLRQYVVMMLCNDMMMFWRKATCLEWWRMSRPWVLETCEGVIMGIPICDESSYWLNRSCAMTQGQHLATCDWIVAGAPICNGHPY